MTENSCCQRLCRSVSRVKTADAGLTETPLQRCLSAADLALMGIGAMVGSGLYILTGEVAANLAGPAATLSFFIAGLAGLLTALLYTECATRFPQTGASYTFTYISLGELMAFLVGWNFIATWVFGAAFVSRGWSAYFDNIIGDQIRNLTVKYLLGGVEWNVPVLAQYPDITGAVVVFLATMPVALGTSLSAKVNGFFVIVNIMTIALVFVFAMIHADFSYLTKHGYFPMGFSGVLVGAAVSFGSGYAGFQAIAFSAEEAKNPSTSLPIGIISAFVVTILNYIAGVIAITVLSEYQNINPNSAFVTAFEVIGLDWMKYVVGIGGLCSMTGSILNVIFSLSRSIFAMARDGLIPDVFAQINRKTKTPIIATLFGSALAVVINIFIDFEVIIQFVSLGFLADYTVVSVVMIFLRYQAPMKSEPTLNDSDKNETLGTSDVKMANLPEILRKSNESRCETEKTRTLAKHPGQSALTNVTSCCCQVPKQWAMKHQTAVVIASLTIHLLFELIAVALVTYKIDELLMIESTVVFGVVLSSGIALISCLPLLVLPHYSDGLAFKVPFMPYLPLVSLLVTVILAVQIEPLAWIQFVVWMAAGVFVYFIFGMHHSVENTRHSEEPSSVTAPQRLLEENTLSAK